MPCQPSRRSGVLTSLILASLCLSSAGCAHRFPDAYGLDDLYADSVARPGDGLVHYLTRQAPELKACDAGIFASPGPTLTEPFARALAGPVPAARWGACAVRLMAWLPAEARESLVAGAASQVTDLVFLREDARLEAVEAMLLARPRGPSPALDALAQRLASAKPATGRTAQRVEALRALLDIEGGRLNGVRLTPTAVAALTDEVNLRRIEARAPDEATREAARRRVIRMHLAASTMAEVKARADEVEAAVFATGRWAQPAASLPAPTPLSARVSQTPLHVLQDIDAQAVRLYAQEGERLTAPRLDARPLVRFDVGWSEPLGLCAPPRALDVSPCIDAAEVRLGTGFASLDVDGVLQVVDTWAMADAIAVTRAGLGLVVPVLLGQAPVMTLQVPLVMRAPANFCFEGPPASPGPAVNVQVTPVTQGLLVEAVDERGTRVGFVLPRDAGDFEFGSCGGRGSDGADGTQGAPGLNGANGNMAMCPSSPGGSGQPGGPGSPGGNGQPGGPGGDGGPVRVLLACDGACPDEVLVRRVFVSSGGAGGRGGRGGVGGPGGRGGNGGGSTSCYANGQSTFVNGGSNGSTGTKGADGAAGMDGAPGLDGVVTFERQPVSRP